MENNNISILKNIWSQIGPFNMSLFSHRLLLQKKIFLLEEMGLKLNYQFGKYLRGPYCSQLASDGFKINAIENFDNVTISEEESINKIKELEKSHEMDASWFELIAFIVYLRNKEGKNMEEIKNKIIEEKPYLFDENTFQEAYNKLIELGIFSNK